MFAEMNSQPSRSFQYMSPVHATTIQTEWGPDSAWSNGQYGESGKHGQCQAEVFPNTEVIVT